MKIYVAGKWQEKHRVRKLMDKLEFLGHEITFDWTQHIDDDTKADWPTQAIHDVKGVQKADCVIALVDKPLRYKGLLTEIGVALGLNIPVFLLGGTLNLDPWVFGGHPLVQHSAPYWLHEWEN